MGLKTLIAGMSQSGGVTTAAVAAAGAILYTTQTLSGAQSGQALANLSPTGGAITSKRLTLRAASNTGMEWVNSGNTSLASVWFDQDHGGAGVGELVLNGQQSIAFGPSDASTVGFITQLTSSGGAGGGGYVYLGRDGVPSGGATIKNSQFLMFNSGYYNGAAPVFTGFNLRSVALDTSGNVAARFAADSTNGNVTTAMGVQTPDGSRTLPGLSIGTTAMGFLKNGASLQIQSNGTDGYALFGGNLLDLKTGNMLFQATSGSGAGSLGIQVYYSTSGFWSNSSTDLRCSVNNADIWQATGTQFNVMSGIALQLGNAAVTGLIAGALAALTNASVTLKDSNGTTYRVPVIV